MRVLGFCLMGNHWHLILWPREEGELSRFMLRLTTTHVRRLHAHYHHRDGGHIYQGRYKSFPVQADDLHLLAVLRYVEANPLRAGLVKRARDWPWSSLPLRLRPPPEDGSILDASPLPLPLPENWEQLVERRWKEAELDELHTSVAHGRPLGDEPWVKRTVRRLGLESTVARGAGPGRNVRPTPVKRDDRDDPFSSLGHAQQGTRVRVLGPAARSPPSPVELP